MKTNLGFGGNLVIEKVYICLVASKQRFKEGCRPLIGQDGCHMLAPRLAMSFIKIDRNNNIFLIAYIVVKVEKIII